jgi:agmatinase
MHKYPNFCELPKELSDYNSSAIVLLPVPYDETSTWMKGADRGPLAILEASPQIEYYDIETDSEVHLLGIHTAEPVVENQSPEHMANEVYLRIQQILADMKFPVILGGEHSVSIGAFKAIAEKYSDLTIVQFDAHTDLRPEYEGTRYNHACAMTWAKALAPIVQIGIRSVSVDEKPFIDQNRIFYAHEIVDNEVYLSNIPRLLTSNVYITIDLDCFDPAYVPSTGTPEPGGLSWYQVIKILKLISKTSNIVGFDIVELCPNPAARASELLAAKLVYKLLTMKFI